MVYLFVNHFGSYQILRGNTDCFKNDNLIIIFPSGQYSVYYLAQAAVYIVFGNKTLSDRDKQVTGFAEHCFFAVAKYLICTNKQRRVNFMLIRFICADATYRCTAFHYSSVKDRLLRSRYCDDKVCIFNALVRIFRTLEGNTALCIFAAHPVHKRLALSGFRPKMLTSSRVLTVSIASNWASA